MILYATGAYGRKANLKDWKAGKDFAAMPMVGKPWIGGRYFGKGNVDLLQELGYTKVRFYDGDSIMGFEVDLAEEKRA